MLQKMSVFLLFSFLLFASCSEVSQENEVGFTECQSVLELVRVDVKSPVFENGRATEGKLEKEVTVKHIDGKEYKATFLVELIRPDLTIVEILKPGTSDLYMKVEIVEEAGLLRGSYYDVNDVLILENVVEGSVMKVVSSGVLQTNVRLNNFRVNGYWDDFSDCTDNFISEVSSSATWSGVFLVGTACCAAEVLAGLAIGCTIYAL